MQGNPETWALPSCWLCHCPGLSSLSGYPLYLSQKPHWVTGSMYSLATLGQANEDFQQKCFHLVSEE